MNGVHVQADAPYQCRKCQFRSSLRIDIIQHFQKVYLIKFSGSNQLFSGTFRYAHADVSAVFVDGKY
jgi:hypothetical protein